MELVVLTEEDFRKFAEKQPGNSFLQSVEMYRRYLERGDESYLLGLKQGEKIVAASLVVARYRVLRRKIFVAARGFLMDYEGEGAVEIFTAMTKAMKKFLKAKGGAVLLISPAVWRVRESDEQGNLVAERWESGEKLAAVAQKLGYKALGEREMVKWVYTVPLEGITEENLVPGLRRNHRRLITAAQKNGVKIRRLETDELGILTELMGETGKRKHFEIPKLSYFEEMARNFGDKVEFLVAEVEEDGKMVPVEAAMFVRWPDEVIVPYSGAKTGAARLGAMQLMMVEGMKMALKRGAKKYNFYGTHPVPGDGVYEFKRGFHGQIEEAVGEFVLPLDWVGRLFVAKQKYHEMGETH